jgi:hypothetical protein
MLESDSAAEMRGNTMPKYLIEIQHPDDAEGCIRALEALSTLGSHLVSNADFGCEDGVHCGWLVVEVGDRREAELIVPPPLRADARVIQLRRWSPEEIAAMAKDLRA